MDLQTGEFANFFEREPSGSTCCASIGWLGENSDRRTGQPTNQSAPQTKPGRDVMLFPSPRSCQDFAAVAQVDRRCEMNREAAGRKIDGESGR